MPQDRQRTGLYPLAHIALGSNLPYGPRGPRETLVSALEMLVAAGYGLVSVSRFFATPAFPAGSGPEFVNAAAVLQLPEALKQCDPAAAAGRMLDDLHAIEAALGRERLVRWGARVIDLDLLSMGDSVLPDAQEQARWRALPPAEQARVAPDRLILPHPRLSERSFVLVPLADVAPDWVDPCSGRSVSQMLDTLPAAEKAAVRPL